MKNKKLLLIPFLLFMLFLLVSCEQTEKKNVEDNVNDNQNINTNEELEISNTKIYKVFDKEFDLEKDYNNILEQYKELLGNDVIIKEKNLNNFKVVFNNKEKLVNLNIEKYYSLEFENDFVLNTEYDYQTYFKKGKNISLSINNTQLLFLNNKIVNFENNMFKFNINGKTKLEKGFYKELTTEEGNVLIDEKIENDSNNFIILDVREQGEYEEGHLFLSHLLDYRMTEIFKEEIKKLDKNKTYLVYCRTDNRSRKAAKLMQDVGIKNIYVMLGGFTKWQKENRPFEKKSNHTENYKIEVENLKDVYNIGQNININIKVLNNINKENKELENKNINIYIKDKNRNIINQYLNISLNEENIYNLNKEINSNYTNNYYYIEIDYVNNDLTYTFFKIFDIQSQRETKTYKEYEDDLAFNHLTDALSDVNSPKLKERFKENILNYQVMDKEYNYEKLYNLVNLDKETIILLVYPGCGACMDLWKSLKHYDFSKYNLLPIITSISKENPQESINSSVTDIQNDPDLLEKARYDGRSYLWEALGFKVTPRVLFLNKKGELVNYLAYVHEENNKGIEKIVEIANKTFKEKVTINNQDDNSNSANSQGTSDTSNNQDNAQDNNTTQNGQTDTDNTNDNQNNGQNNLENQGQGSTTNTSDNNSDVNNNDNSIFIEKTASDLEILEKKTPYFYRERLNQNHYFEKDTNPVNLEILKSKYSVNYENILVTNFEDEDTKINEIRKNQDKLNFLVFLDTSSSYYIDKVEENKEKFEKLFQYANFYFLLTNTNSQALAYQKTSNIDNNIRKNFFFYNTEKIQEKFKYTYYPKVLVLDSKYSTTDILEYENLYNNHTKVIEYIKKLTNTLSIKKLEKTYQDRLDTGEFKYLQDSSKQVRFEQQELYAYDLSNINIIDIKGVAKTIQSITNSAQDKITILGISLSHCHGCHSFWHNMDLLIKTTDILKYFNYIDFINNVYDKYSLNSTLNSNNVEDKNHFYYSNFDSKLKKINLNFPTILLLDKDNKIAAAMSFFDVNYNNLMELYNLISKTTSIK